MPTVLVQNEALEVEIDAGENLQNGLSKSGVTVYDFHAVRPLVKPLSALVIILVSALAFGVVGYMIAGMSTLQVFAVLGALFGGYCCKNLLLSDHTQVIVLDGRDNLNEPTDREIRALGDERVAAGIRLASEVQVNGDCQIHCHP